MALSNKQGKLLLTTGNKSEMSVVMRRFMAIWRWVCAHQGCTQTAGFINYQLPQYAVRVIPERVITRPPSAELAPDQIDADSLPPYEVLDPILERYVELDQSAEEIIAAGFRREDVPEPLNLVDRNEYKRRQSPPGIRITSKAFGRDRRYPITSGYRGI